jgi:hypothetical protein
MTRCTCTVFARSGKLHHHDCPKRKAYVRGRERREQALITSTREGTKAGKHERIRKMLAKLSPPSQPMIEEEVLKLIAMQEGKK